MVKRKPQPSKSYLDSCKAFFKYSESIFLARIFAFGGLITSLVGAMDFSPLWSLFSTGTDFTPKQLLFVGVSIVGMGVSFEMARRRGSDL